MTVRFIGAHRFSRETIAHALWLYFRFHIIGMEAVVHKDQTVSLWVMFEVPRLDQVSRLMSRLEGIRDVFEVVREVGSELRTARQVYRAGLSIAIDLLDVIWRSRADKAESSAPALSLATLAAGVLAGSLVVLAVVAAIVTVLGGNLTIAEWIILVALMIAGAVAGGWARLRGRPRREQ